MTIFNNSAIFSAGLRDFLSKEKNMRKKILLFCVLALSFVLFFNNHVQSVTSSPTSQTGNLYLIDNFDDGNITANPVWWTFGNISVKVVNRSLIVSGKAKNWFVGGMGTLLAKINVDLGRYNAVQMAILGSGPGSGTIRIELMDDDKGTGKYEPLYDDTFSYDIIIDWSGWKNIIIPINKFKSNNPKLGNGKLNMTKKNGKGGLLQINLLFTASKENSSMKLNIDNLALVIK